MESAADRTPTKQPSVPVAIADDLAFFLTAMANVYFYGPTRAGDRGWVLIDAGVYGFAGRIRRAAEQRFGREARPEAIILTHGHFDHIGAARELAEDWDVPIYAHEMELPYLTGRSPYPPGDSTVGGGAVAALAWLYPRGPEDLTPRIQPLPFDRSVPGMPGWRWIHTPGHSPGHIALYNDQQRFALTGDAIVTVKQESLFAVLQQRPEIHGPPAYYTPDWESAELSVQTIADLDPVLIAAGHGVPLRGPEALAALRELAENFEKLAVPRRGRYVGQPAETNAGGVVSVPPASMNWAAIIIAVGATMGLLALWLFNRSRSSD